MSEILLYPFVTLCTWLYSSPLQYFSLFSNKILCFLQPHPPFLWHEFLSWSKAILRNLKGFFQKIALSFQMSPHKHATFGWNSGLDACSILGLSSCFLYNVCTQASSTRIPFWMYNSWKTLSLSMIPCKIWRQQQTQQRFTDYHKMYFNRSSESCSIKSKGWEKVQD